MSVIICLLSLIPSVLSLITTIDYNLIHSGAYMFSTGLNETYIIDNYDSLDKCKKMCDKNSLCLGITNYYSNNSIECNLLSDLGDTMSTSLNISSYRKFTRYYDNDNYSIYGTVDTSDNKYNLIDTDIYIDMNHNGVHDPTEPITQSYNGNFNFTNLREGKYLIRETTPPECTQLYPGARGNYHTINGDGYADTIVYIHTHTLTGGYINKSGAVSKLRNPRHMDHTFPTSTPPKPTTSGNIRDITNKISGFILGESSDRYLTFFPGDEIIMSFVDETIIDTNGTDIFINTYKNSSTQAHVSVGYNGVNYTYIGILNSTHNEFDLGNVNYKDHVSYIRLHFFGGHSGINIVTLQGATDSLYSPSFGYYIEVPHKKLKQSIVFLNDCHYHYDCILHCFLGNLNLINTYSCLSGCNLLNKSYKCECENYLETGINYTNDFNIDKCYEGCEYKLEQFLFPDYKLYKNSIGSAEEHHIINSINMEYCNPKENMKCLLNMRDICKKRDICQSISIDNENLVNYNNIERNYHNSSYLIVKNTHIGYGGINYSTTTSSTSTPTSSTSSTTSISSTPTSSTSSTPTSSTSSTSTSISSTNTPINATSINATSRTDTSINANSSITHLPEKNKGKKDTDEKIKIIYIISGILFCLVGSIIIYTFLFCRNLDTKKPLQPDNKVPISFENPVYERKDLFLETLPGEPIEDEFDPDKDYVEIQ